MRAMSAKVDGATAALPLFFDKSKVSPTNEYICWIDVMGSQSIMLRSLKIASNFVMKLHIAALRASETIFVKNLEIHSLQL